MYQDSCHDIVSCGTLFKCTLSSDLYIVIHNLQDAYLYITKFNHKILATALDKLSYPSRAGAR